MPISIENADAGDIEALVELLMVLFSIEQDFIPNQSAQRNGLKLILNKPEQGQIFVARHRDAGIVGMVSAQFVISTAVGAPSAWIEDMIVQEQFRGKGVGKALLDRAREWAMARGAKRIQLLADADNAPALDFYQHLGWQPTRLFAWKKQFD
ncbi:MAG: GNAT family N-acetyltransferase [Gallionella sp.]